MSTWAKGWWVVGALVLSACGPEWVEEGSPGGLEDELLGASTQDITDVSHTPVKRQSIGNCWLYATASWAEALHRTHAGASVNMSESYWTYWHWFEQLANGRTTDELKTGGSWGVGVDLIRRYGVMTEASFIPSESWTQMSNRQKTALDAINLSLQEGVLKDPAVRRDRARVRAELDRAWQLSGSVIAELDAVFGPSVTRTLDRSTVDLTGRRVRHAQSYAVGTVTQPDGSTRTLTLADAIGLRAGTSSPDVRSGQHAWREVSYPSYAGRARRALQQRVQKALHAGQPVVITWFVDFNALNADGAFAAPPETIGRQGGHVTVLEDYEVTQVPGFGTLPAGERETRPEALEAALDPSATVTFFRTKNSWGTYRPDRPFVIPGYHDLHLAYLDGPVKRCLERAPEPADVPEDDRECLRSTPTAALYSFVLPPGF